jgi:WhiB family transcriptional regulator, redox-sensing transcriptional regulator
MAIPHRIGEAADPGLTGPVRALPWADRALCANTDPELFFSDIGTTYITIEGTREMTAKAICRRCPVKPECRDYAMADPHLEGVWGGMTGRERETERGRQTRGTA